MLKVEQGNAGLWYVTSDVIPGLLVAGGTQKSALEQVGQALADIQAAMDAAGSSTPAPAASSCVEPTQDMVIAGLVALVAEIERIQGPIPPAADGQVLSDRETAQRYMNLGAIMRSGREVVAAYKAMIAAAPPVHSAASTVEPVAYVPLSKSPNNPGEPVWRETFPAEWIETGSERWQGYKLKALYFAAPTTSPEPEEVPYLSDAAVEFAKSIGRHASLETERLRKSGASPEPDAVRVEISDEDMRDLLASKDVGSGRAKLRRLLSLKSTAALSRPAHGGWLDAMARAYLVGRGYDSCKIDDLQNTHAPEWAVAMSIARVYMPPIARNDRVTSQPNTDGGASVTDKTIVNWNGGSTLQTWKDGEWQILYVKDATGREITLSLADHEAYRFAWALSPAANDYFERMRAANAAVYELSYPEARADSLRQVADEIDCGGGCDKNCGPHTFDRGDFCAFAAADDLRKLATALDLKAKVDAEQASTLTGNHQTTTSK